MDILEIAKDLLKKVDFDRIKDFNKDNDILILKVSFNHDLENDVDFEQLKRFVKMLHDNGYKTIVLPKEIDITVENKDNIKKMLKLTEKSLENL